MSATNFISFVLGILSPIFQISHPPSIESDSLTTKRSQNPRLLFTVYTRTRTFVAQVYLAREGSGSGSYPPSTKLLLRRGSRFGSWGQDFSRGCSVAHCPSHAVKRECRTPTRIAPKGTKNSWTCQESNQGPPLVLAPLSRCSAKEELYH